MQAHALLRCWLVETNAAPSPTGPTPHSDVTAPLATTHTLGRRRREHCTHPAQRVLSGRLVRDVEGGALGHHLLQRPARLLPRLGLRLRPQPPQAHHGVLLVTPPCLNAATLRPRRGVSNAREGMWGGTKVQSSNLQSPNLDVKGEEPSLLAWWTLQAVVVPNDTQAPAILKGFLI